MSAVDITVERVNASFIRLYTDDEGIRKTIHDHFTYHEPGFVKNKWSKWDGVTRMFKLRGNLLPYGCLMMLMELSKTNGWKLEMDEAFRNDVSSVTRAELKEWVATLDLRSGGHVIDPYDYQLESLYLSIKYNRIVILAATSAGKSLIIYLLARYYEMLHDQDGKKTLIIVPSQMLVDQLFQDFKDYSTVNGWDVEATVHTIMQGRPKTSRKSIFISTWQSIFEEDAEYFSVFGRLVNDETHGSSGKSITGIFDKCVNAYQRVGMTGTLKSTTIHPVQVMSLMGPIRRVVTTKQLIDAGRATEVDIKMFQLNYQKEESEYVSTCTYQDEIEFLVTHNYRSKIIASVAASCSGNTLAIFDRLEHIDAVKAILDTMDHGKSVYVITGSVDKDERADIKAIAERDDGVIVLGTSGCVATGLSIKRLRNLLLAHPTKSIVKILQSIGRILRLHDDKSYAHVYDFVDNLSFGDKPNFALRHAIERVSIYKDGEFPLTFKSIPMKLSNPPT